MKSSFDRLRRFELYKSGSKDKKDFQPSVHVDELAQASQVLHSFPFLISYALFFLIPESFFSCLMNSFVYQLENVYVVNPNSKLGAY